MVAPNERNPGIDALRGLSVALVVVHHVAIRIPLGETALGELLPPRVVHALAFSGYEAVFLFFVISGFLITTHSLRRWGSLAAIDARAFYARRLARIAPTLLVLLGILALLHLAGARHYVIDGPEQSLGGALFSALALHLNWYEGQTGWLPGAWDVLWSLSIEELFYLAFPVLCLVVGRLRGLLTLVLVGLALSLPWTRAALADATEIWQEKAYLPAMAAIAAGVVAGLAAERWPAPSRGITTLALALGGAAIAAVLLAARELWPHVGYGLLLVLTVGCGLALMGLHWRWRSGWSRAPSRAGAWLRACGRLSYEIYLAHMFVVFALVDAFKAHGGDRRSGWIVYLLALLGSWGLGALVSRLLTSPADRALRRRLLGGAR
ncbi:MAG: acyltransferase [Myxococcales bacterium]|nr:acyltransferase [Myxococcales bacterium]